LIQQYQQETQQYTEDLDGLVSSGESLSRDLTAQEKRLGDAGQEKNFYQDSLAKAASDMEAAQDDYAKAISLVDQAIELLDAARGYSGKAFTSFVQSKSTTYKDVSQGLRKLTTVGKIGADEFTVAPIAELFIQMAKGDELDIVALTQARGALSDLKDYLVKGLESLHGIYGEYVSQVTAIFDNLVTEINTLNNQSIPQTQRDLQTNSESQTEKSSQLSLARQNVQWTSGQLNAENQSWDQRVTLNSLLLPQYDSEYAIVVQADAIIKNAAKSG